MNIVGEVLKNSLGKAIDGLVNKYLPPSMSEKEKAQFEFDKAKMLLEAEGSIISAVAETDKAQAEVNKAEAMSDDKFSRRWRPALGWTCVIAIFSATVPYYVLSALVWTILAIKLIFSTGQIPPRPDLEYADVLNLAITMIGGGLTAYLRTQEKVKGVAK